MLMEEYKNQRAHFQKDLQRNFIRIMQAPTAQVELDHFIDIVNASVTPEVEDHMKMMHPFMSFPGKVSRIRAYVYSAVASEKNTVEVQEQMFLAACNRFGLETPVPTVHTRCQLYGNSSDIVRHLAKAEAEFNEAKGTHYRVDAKEYVHHTMGQPIKKTLVRKKSMDM